MCVTALAGRNHLLRPDGRVAWRPTALIRRMHAIVSIVLGQLHAGTDWGAIGAEYLHREPPATPLGEAAAAKFATR